MLAPCAEGAHHAHELADGEVPTIDRDELCPLFFPGRSGSL